MCWLAAFLIAKWHFIETLGCLLQVKMLGLLLAVFVLVAIIVYLSIRLFEPPTRQIFVGYLTVASLISMFASPLFVIVRSSLNFTPTFFFIEGTFCFPLVQCVTNNFWSTEFGDQDEERWVHAILSFSFNLLDESLILCIWDF